MRENRPFYRTRKGRQLITTAICILLILFVFFVIWQYTHRSENPEETGGTPQASYMSSALSSEDSSEFDILIVNPDDPENEWQLRLVNEHYGLDDDYEPDNLKPTLNNVYMDGKAADAVLDMVLAAEDDGVTLYLLSGYRSISEQTQILERDINTLMNEGYSYEEAYKQARKTVQDPGHSEHHTGLAIDIISPDWYTYNSNLNEGFEDTPQFDWLKDNAHTFGFVLRYPRDKVDITGIDYEAWHYRYVGVDNATKIRQLGICLEEYLDKEQ